MPERYSSRQDVIEQAILPALYPDADDYDVDAIADDTYEWRVEKDADGNELLNTAGFVPVKQLDAFWQSVQAHLKPGADGNEEWKAYDIGERHEENAARWESNHAK